MSCDFPRIASDLLCIRLTIVGGRRGEESDHEELDGAAVHGVPLLVEEGAFGVETRRERDESLSVGSAVGAQ